MIIASLASWFLHIIGSDNVSGPWYGFWSGFGSDIGELVLLGGLIITCGHVLLGLAPSSAVFFLGLLLIVLGTGLLKPNASVLVAGLYPQGGAAGPRVSLGRGGNPAGVDLG